MSYPRTHVETSPSTTSSTKQPIPGNNKGPKLSHQNGAKATSDTPPTSAPKALNNKRRRPSKLKPSALLSGGTATSHPRRLVMSDSDLDKKRNKLGYQRISIACAHCRRRKIRCLVADGDPQRRCQNCIRLKKECVFYPVEQQSAMGTKSQSSSNNDIGSGDSTAVSPSPPDVGSGHFPDHRDFSSFQTLPSNAPNVYQGMPLEPNTTLAGQDTIHQPEFLYQAGETRPPWPSNELSPPQTAPGHASFGHPNEEYWRYDQRGPNGDFAPFPNDPIQPLPPHNSHAFALPPPTSQHNWQQQQHQPVRAMSYPHSGGIIPSTSSPYSPQYHADASNNMRYTANVPPTLEMQFSQYTTHGPGPHSAPAVEPPATFGGPPGPYGFQGDRSQPSNSALGPQSVYTGSWFSEPASYDPNRGEGRGPS